MSRRITVAAIVLAAALAAAACGSDDTTADTAAENTDDTAEESGGAETAETGNGADDAPTAPGDGIRVVSPADGASILDDPPADLIVLDVRTADEFADGHLPGATLIDFYAPDFADQLAELDPEVPYLLYCRSGNRSGQARELMEQMGFADVADVDGGIVAWSGAGLPVEQ